MDDTGIPKGLLAYNAPWCYRHRDVKQDKLAMQQIKVDLPKVGKLKIKC